MMSSLRRWLAGLSVVSIATLGLPAAAIESAPGYAIPLRAGPSVGAPSLVAEPTTKAKRAARINVTYTGFSAPARAAFQRAIDIWARQIVSPVPINVRASFERLGPGILGSAGPGTFYRDFPGGRPNTWYPVGIANKLARKQLDPQPDIIARFSSAFPNWHFAAGPAPANKYDFTTVVLHELGHGLGFLGLGTIQNNRGTVKFDGRPSIYDTFTENLQGKRLTTFPDNSAQLAQVLRSNNLFYQLTPTQRVKLYAPTTFSPGSSYSHFDEATFRKGNPNSLMTPQLGQGETIRNPGPFALRVFKNSGW